MIRRTTDTPSPAECSVNALLRGAPRRPVSRRPASGRAPRRAARGMTLVELLLVLVLLVIIGSMAAPVVTGSYASVRLRRAGDQVLAAWSEARVKAVDSGVIFQFQYKPDEGVFRIGPFSGADAMAFGNPSYSGQAAAASSVDGSGGYYDSRNNSTASPTTTTPYATTATSYDSEPVDDDLTSSIKFDDGEIAVDDPMAEEARVDSLETQGESWSTPILFFPDGTCSSTSVVIVNDREQHVRLTLRGLTGVGRASRVLSSSEAMRSNSRRQ